MKSTLESLCTLESLVTSGESLSTFFGTVARSSFIGVTLESITFSEGIASSSVIAGKSFRTTRS